MNYLVSNGWNSEVFALRDEAIPLGNRLAYLDAIFDLNRDCFEPRCTPCLSHLRRSGDSDCDSELNFMCYMWWDIFIIWGDREDKLMEPLSEQCLKVIEKCLELSNIAVIEGALHGLGHFAGGYPLEASRIIDAFLDKGPEISQALEVYARNAREGGVL
jgi:hypothetical protein